MKTQNFDLITEADRKAANDSQDWSKVITAQILKVKKEGKGDDTEDFKRLEQLREYKVLKYQENCYNTIEIKAEAINRCKLEAVKLKKKFADINLDGAKFHNQDGSINFKQREMFKRISIKEDNVTVNIYFTDYNGRVSAKISVNTWSPGTSSQHEEIVYLYSLKSDGLHIETNYDDTQDHENAVNFIEELNKVRAYLAYKKEAEEKIRKLERACNSSMLPVIKSNLI